MKKFLPLLIIFVAGCGCASANELHLIISGKSVHEGSRDYNENNWGLGLEYDFSPRNNWIPFVTGVSFKDSNKEISNYVGGGAKYRIPFGKHKHRMHVDLGVVGFLMTRKDRNDNKPFLGALPFVSVGNDWVALNASYVPPVSPKSVSLLYLQVMFRLARFD